jgi:DNA polymerase (family 10)
VPIHNADIADIFNEVADLLDIQGANQFRIRAYRSAARTVQDLPRSAADMVEEGEDLSRLPGIGKDLAGKIETIVRTGTLPLLKELGGETPQELSALMDVAGLGPKRIKKLYRELGVKSIGDLEKAARAHGLRGLEGFGEKTEQNVLKDIARLRRRSGRIKIHVADEIAKAYAEYLKRDKGVKELTVAGSYRRRKETVGDLDILASVRKGTDIMDRFVSYENVERVLSKGTTKSTVLLRSGAQVDLRVIPQASYGAALHYFTGSKAHNIAVRTIGVKKKLKINEYGVFRGQKRIAGRREEEVFEQVGLPYIPPELRENRGEIEAAREGKLPKLITLEDIRGDLHAHTKRTDGKNTLEEMAEGARERGYEYLAITEHSKHVTVARGLDEKALAQEIKKIEKLNGRLRGITLLKGIELDILEDGSLDLPDRILKELDVVVCSVHYKFNLSREKQTERVMRAMDNPCFNIFAHPSGRLIGEREPYEIDMERVLEHAGQNGCFLEVNAHPERLDLVDVHCKEAKEMGVKLAICTDAHSVANLDFMRYGIGQARRGWLEAGDVINTRSLKDLRKLLKRT